MNADKQLIVISDLDGTLLDHYSYQFEAAQPALALLADNHIPLVLNSSKTAAEILEIRKALNNHQPFIAENGGGIYLPEADGYRSVAIGRPRTEFLPELYDLRDRLQLSFVGFHDMSSQQLMEHTGLTEYACRLAKQRDYTEPLLWKDSVEALQKFTGALKQQGLQVLRGGRFVHVSDQTDKGAAVRWLKRYFQEQMNRRIEIAALGDSDNDLAMLAEADYPFLIRSPVHPPPDIQLPNLKISDQFGPAGWNECICQFLESHT